MIEQSIALDCAANRVTNSKQGMKERRTGGEQLVGASDG